MTCNSNVLTPSSLFRLSKGCCRRGHKLDPRDVTDIVEHYSRGGVEYPSPAMVMASATPTDYQRGIATT